MTDDVRVRITSMSEVLEKVVSSGDFWTVRELKRVLDDAGQEIDNLRLRLRHAYDRENTLRESRPVEVPTPPAPRRFRGWRWQR